MRWMLSAKESVDDENTRAAKDLDRLGGDALRVCHEGQRPDPIREDGDRSVRNRNRQHFDVTDGKGDVRRDDMRASFGLRRSRDRSAVIEDVNQLMGATPLLSTAFRNYGDEWVERISLLAEKGWPDSR